MMYHSLPFGSHLSLVIVLAGAGVQSSGVSAQDVPPIAAADDQGEDDFHDPRSDAAGEIVVTATGLRQLDVLAGTSVLQGVELQRNLAGQLGETLAKLPGVSATSFSPGASRPVLRGFAGERVRVLVDGLGAIDVSNTSADHAVSIDPLTAERIEVLRGPAVLLYGSQAIGGAVNVVDKRIPRRVPREAVHIDALLGADTAFDLREAGASLDAPLGGGFVAHVDGSYRTTDDVAVAGFTLSPRLRAEILAEASEEAAEGAIEEASELREAAQQRGVLPNSATETFSANAGIALFRGNSNFGASVGLYDTLYGVPGRPGTGHAHGDEEGAEKAEEEGEERVTIDLRQYRADFRGDIDLSGGPFARMILRAGFSDYTHTEFEGEEVGTVFDVSGLEARAEFEQRERTGWRGSIGTQYYFRDFDAFGAEAYVPRNRTDQFSVFTLQEFGDGPVHVEVAGRYENTQVESGPLGIERAFDAVSGAIGLAYETAAGLRFGINGSRAVRAPSAEELFSNGPHIAIQAFEIGDPLLAKETALGAEAFVRGRLAGTELSAAIYHSWFDDYIFLAETGEEEDDLPVFQYLQGDARYFGAEAQAIVPLHTGTFNLDADLRADYVRAELDDGTPLPRIPPLTLYGALEAGTRVITGRAELQWFAKQDRVAPFETTTDSFTYVNASLTWRPIRGGNTVSVILQGENLFDVTGRRHASFTKEFVPLAGRNFKASVRASF